MNHRGPKPPELEVATIAAHLEGLEETIISRLIDRAQFSRNDPAYHAGESGFSGEDARSLFLIRLLYQEQMDARFGRFCVPEERPFYRDLPRPQRSAMLPDTGLRIDDFDCVNQMERIIQAYLDLLSRVCRAGDDGHYGSSVEHDVYAVQAIARRIHYGSLYVAESKFRDSPDIYTRLAARGDEQAIITSLTRREVEDRIVERIREKTAALQSTLNPLTRHAIDPEVIATFYRDTIVPLTKKGEVAYLMNRKKQSRD
jgi:chorismate mutase